MPELAKALGLVLTMTVIVWSGWQILDYAVKEKAFCKGYRR